MRYRKLTDDFDYSFGQGQNNLYINSPEAVGQAVRTRLLLLKNEWFLDTTDGTDMDKVLGVNTKSTRDLIVKNRILSTPGVRELTSYSSDVVDRNFSVVAAIDTIYGQTTVEVPFQ